MRSNILKWITIVGLMLGCGTAQIGESVAASGAALVPGQDYVANEILVKFKPGISKEIREQVRRRLGALSQDDAYGSHYQAIKFKEGTVEEMVDLYLRHAVVEYAEPNYIYRAYFTPDDPGFSVQWHLTQINVERAWDMSTGQGVTVAVLDSGVNPAGFDGFGGRLVSGYSAVNPSNRDFTKDNNGHGTHVAGTIAQQTNNAAGVAGIAFNASIMPVKVLNKMGWGTNRQISDGIRWAADHGADIINLSLGGYFDSRTMKDAVDYAYNRGVVLVAASGNEGAIEVAYPAAYENCIAVGAVGYDEVVADYSNRGLALDIVAPGGDVTEDLNEDGFADGVLQETFRFSFAGRALGWWYPFWQGTSMASPHVAGVAALIIAVNPGYTPDDVRDAIVNTAKDLDVPGWDEVYGYGLLDAAAAVEY
jgi:serine protease